MSLQRIILSRTDSIGDVMLTLPMCGVIKKHFPDCEIIFLGRSYTQAVVECCVHVDHFENWDDWKDLAPQVQIEKLRRWNADTIIHVFPRKEILWVAKRARIPLRIATGRRLYTISKCNRLVFFTRRKSPLHEAQLNLRLLKPVGIDAAPDLEELISMYGFEQVKPLPPQWKTLIDPSLLNVILHPGSKGSAAEWGLANYKELIALLPQKDVRVFITGTKVEGEQIRKVIDPGKISVTDMTGKLSLDELVSFIAACDVLVAASTGPLHIAAASGIHAIGLYSPKRPIHPGRWAPIGKHAQVIVASSHPLKGTYLDIDPSQVAAAVLAALKA